MPRPGWAGRIALPLLAVLIVASSSLFMVALRPRAAAASSTPVVTTYPGISSPLGLAVGPDGAIWFTNTDDNSIGRITTGGINTNYRATGSTIRGRSPKAPTAPLVRQRWATTQSAGSPPRES